MDYQERVVELRHQSYTAADYFYYPSRSPMHEGMIQIRKEKRLMSGNSLEEENEFIKCDTTLLIDKNDEGLFVTSADLDRIWLQSSNQITS